MALYNPPPGSSPFPANKKADIANMLMQMFAKYQAGKMQGQDRQRGYESQQIMDKLRQAQTQETMMPPTQAPESGSSLLARMKAVLGEEYLDSKTTDKRRKEIRESPVWGKAGTVVNVGDQGKSVAEQIQLLESLKGTGYEGSVSGGKVSVKEREPPSATEREALAETEGSLADLANLKSLFDNPQTGTGPVKGRIDPIAGLVGATSDEQEAFMAATSAFKNAVIKQITGAQMSEPEARRIMKQVPDITDPPTRWKAKYEQTKRNLNTIQKKRLSIQKGSGLAVPNIVPQEPIYASNGKETIISYDGGATWQKIK